MKARGRRISPTSHGSNTSFPLCEEASAISELKFKPGTWERHGVPEAGCWLRTGAIAGILTQDSECQINLLMHGLMDWLDVTDDPKPSLDVLRQILNRHYPDDGRSRARCHFEADEGSSHTFDAADSVADRGALVAWQRQNWVIALAAASSEPGRMVVGAPAPISLQVATSIINHSLTNYMLEPFDSFEGARATSRKAGSLYRRAAGQTALIDWNTARGSTTRDDKLIEGDGLAGPPHHEWLPPNQLANQVAIAGGYLF